MRTPKTDPVTIGIRSVGRFFLFIAGGLAVIIVGFFMLRGNMRMWDRPHNGGNDNMNTRGGWRDGGDAAGAADGNGDGGNGSGSSPSQDHTRPHQ